MSDAVSPSEDVKAFFKNPEIAQKILGTFASDKPEGWSRRSNAPYYKECYALVLKDAADTMLKTREDCIYFYKDWPRLSPITVYLMVNQSIRYLVNVLDDKDLTYAKWNAIVNITKERGTGVRISFDEGARNLKSMEFVKPKSVVAANLGPTWKQDVDNYLEDDRMTKPLLISKLCLNPDEIKLMRDSLRPLKGIIFEVTSYEIRIIKVNE